MSVKAELLKYIKMTRDEKQQDAVRKWIKAGGRGIFSHPTGFGKVNY